jgi:hypothetical protein
MTQRIIIPVRVALEMCSDDTIEPAIWAHFLKMVSTGEIEIVPDDMVPVEKVPDARPY